MNIKTANHQRVGYVFGITYAYVSVSGKWREVWT